MKTLLLLNFVYILQLKAEETKTSEKFSSTATVTVKIENKNDNMPDFLNAPFNASVYEESPPGRSVYQVNVSAVYYHVIDNINICLI